jgi:DtxR family Mn-dependent transcriptional regulator
VDEMGKKQTARMEDYLEAVLELEREEGRARVSSIARKLGVTMPTVNSAVNRLSEQKLVKHDRYGDVELTRDGREIASEILRRHEMLGLFLTEILGMDEEAAQRDACEMEHSLSPEAAERLTSFVEFILEAPREPQWLKKYSYYYVHGERPQECYEKST